MPRLIASGTSTHLTILDAIPYVVQFLTVIIALAAIISTRRSSRDSLVSELRQRMWEKKTDAYLDILREVTFFDPREIAPKKLRDEAEAGKEVQVLERLESAEWLEFAARVEAVSSEEVRYLFSLWQRTLAGWTWILSKAVLHIDPGSEAHEEAEQELSETYDAIGTARLVLTEQIRGELRFEDPVLPTIEYESPEAYFGAITRLHAYQSHAPKYPLARAARIRSVKREEHGHQFGIQL